MRLFGLIVIALLVIILGAGALQITRARTFEREARLLAGGNPMLGKDAMRRYGCIACHVTPGFTGTNPHVGPPLESFGQRTFVAGVAENTPDNLTRFIREPRSVAPQSAMPVLGVSETDARDIATYLYTLR
jgi:cytochrome c